jgi:hypothetical protein
VILRKKASEKDEEVVKDVVDEKFSVSKGGDPNEREDEKEKS